MLALCFDKNPAHVLSAVTLPAEEVCIARLLEFKKFSVVVEGIKAKYNLNDSFAWREAVLKLGSKKKLAGAGKGTTVAKIGSSNKKAENESKPTVASEKKERKTKAQKQERKRPASPSLEKQEPKIKKQTVKIDAPLTVDPFFITSDGTNYMSTVAPEEIPENVGEEGTSAVPLNRRARRSGMMPKPNAAGGANRAAPKLEVFAQPEIDLEAHPSWAAKRKQKVIPHFQGKKVTFDADDEGAAPKETTKNAAREELHPSWAAKQKLKPVISEFKGTKVTFSDDD